MLLEEDKRLKMVAKYAISVKRYLDFGKHVQRQILSVDAQKQICQSPCNYHISLASVPESIRVKAVAIIRY